MPPFDREGALKKAEKALRQGRIDAAIDEYVRIVEAQPRDWNSANALGDLYIRANKIDKGIAQYMRIAQHLATEGFYPKAAAIYKKILKIKPDDENSLLEMGDLAAKQKLLADAKNSFRLVGERRAKRGDKKGAAEIAIRIGTLDPDDLEARLGAAAAALQIGDKQTALREYREVARKLDEDGRTADAVAAFQSAYELDSSDSGIRERLLHAYVESGDLTRARAVATSAAELKQIAAALQETGRADQALEVLAAVAKLDPADIDVKIGLAQAYAAKGDLASARDYLSPETAGQNGALWLMLAEIELNAGRVDDGKAAIVRALSLDDTLSEAVVQLGCRLAERAPETGYPAVEIVVDGALAKEDYKAAASGLQHFVAIARHHVIALMRLVDVCVDGGFDTMMYEAQAQLADAYLEAGRALEARIISEDLFARDPSSEANVDRFRRALQMSGEENPDAVIEERLRGESPFLEVLDLNEGVSFEEAKPESAAPPPPPAAAAASPKDGKKKRPAAGIQQTEDEAEEDVEVVDLDEAPAPAPKGAAKGRTVDPASAVVRDDSSREAAEETAAEQYRLAVTYRELGMLDEAFSALEAAARSPRQRFEACAMLGRLCLDRGELKRAVDWFERAAEAPSPTPDSGRGLLYELAETLERVGEHGRALAVFVELESESGGYRDVASRIERLSKVQAKG